MAIVSSRYCSACERQVAAERNSPNHVLHALLTLFLCGLWLPVWIFATLNQTYRCPRCGKVCKTLFDKIALAVLVVLLVIVGGLVAIGIMSQRV